VSSYSKGKVFERAEGSNKTKMFAGSGVVSFEKDKISVPTSTHSTTARHEYGVHYMVQDLLHKKLSMWGKTSPGTLNG
jgi:hypothetical protein